MKKFFQVIAVVCFIGLIYATHPVIGGTLKCFNIKVVVPYGVGSATDMVMRAYTETINRKTSGPLLKVVNSTKKFTYERIIKSTPDGCMLIATTPEIIANFLLDNTSPQWSDLQPIVMLTRSPLVVVARSNLKDANLPNILEQASSDPNAIAIGESIGSLQKKYIMWLENAARARFRIVSYDTGRENLIAILANQLDIGLLSVTAAKRRVDQKELQALAITSEARTPNLSGVATLKEQGIGAIFGVDRGIMAPPSTPLEIVGEISNWFKKASEDTELAARLEKLGTQIMFLETEAYTLYLENLTADWNEMINHSTKSNNLTK